MVSLCEKICVHGLYILSLCIIVKSFRYRLYLSAVYALTVLHCMIFWLHPSGIFWIDCYFAGYLFFISVGSLCARHKSLVAPYLFLRNKGIKKVLWVLLTVMSVGGAGYIMISRWDVFFSRNYKVLRISDPLISSRFHWFVFYIGVPFYSLLMILRLKNKFLGVLCFIGVSYWLSFFCFSHACARLLMVAILAIFLKVTGDTKLSIFRLLFLATVLIFMPIFVVSTTFYKKVYSVYDRIVLDESRMSYPTIEFVEKSNWHTYGSCSFSHLYALFASPKFPVGLVTLNLTCNRPPFTQPPRDEVGKSAPSSSAVGLYADFRLFSFIFAFFLGFLLKSVDDVMIFFISIRKLDFEVALVYSFFLYTSHCFCHTTYGTVLCSYGLVFFIALFVHYVNENLYSNRETIPETFG